MIHDYICLCIKNAITKLVVKKGITDAKLGEIVIEVPKSEQHGDYASNLAMVSAGIFKKPPRKLAEDIISELSDPRGWIVKSEIAGPGFINFFVEDTAWHEILKSIIREESEFGKAKWGNEERVQVEFVSANPTGPLHVGHGRGAVVGDVIARTLEATGHRVFREYYVNDAGRQMDILARSIYIRYLQLHERKVDLPEDHYQGEYIEDLAREIKAQRGDMYLHMPETDSLSAIGRYGMEKILAGIEEDLRSFDVHYDLWFSERSLVEEGNVAETVEELKNAGLIYEKEGAWWFKSGDFGDEKDRVVVRSNGVMTYFASDLAYHRNKFERGFQRVIDVWGADHHGYVPRVKAGVEALGRNPDDLQVVLVQLVNLLRHGQPVAMSTRAGEFVTLRDVVTEVGKDAARYIFLTRRSDSHLDFDLELAKEKSSDNPVFYVQYAHARISSLFRVAEREKVYVDWVEEPDFTLLIHPQERQMMKILARYPSVVSNSARFLEPHRLPYYLNDLVSVFHSYYNKNRIISDNKPLMKARFFLVKAIQIVLQNALSILGVTAPKRM